jgi:thiol-disulfide isomerase/thioredoxin
MALIALVLVLVASVANAQGPPPDEATRARALVAAVRADLRPPLTIEHIRAAEKARADLDHLSDSVAGAKIEVHGLLGQLLRDIDYDDGIAFHANAIIDLAPKLDSADRVRLAHPLIYAYRNLAEVVAGHGNTPVALQLLINAPAGLRGVPGVVDGLADEVARYQMVGQRAPAIAAPHWFNTAANTETLDPGAGGPVTIIELTAWWCAACERSYAELDAIQKKYGANRVRLVMSTSLMGRFRRDTALAPDAELAKLRAYYTTEHKLTCPIAVADDPGESLDPVSKRYHVYAIPETVIIDRHGIVQRILLGWDEGNGKRVDEAITAALGAAQ